MSLPGSIQEIQANTEKIYLKLEERFSGNKIIRELWGKMARDISDQIASLHNLPKSFWTRLKQEQESLEATIQAKVHPQNIDNTTDLSLSACIESAIRSEESIIRKLYVPLIRNLRKNWSGRELDFYIMVKAHIVRIKRAAESFSGSPVIMQQAASLFHTFEKEVQEPEIDLSRLRPSARKPAKSPKKPPVQAHKAAAQAAQPAQAPKSAHPPRREKAPPQAEPAKEKATPVSKPKKEAGNTTKEAAKKSPPRISRSDRHRSAAKPLVQKAAPQRKRARR